MATPLSFCGTRWPGWPMAQARGGWRCSVIPWWGWVLVDRLTRFRLTRFRLTRFRVTRLGVLCLVPTAALEPRAVGSVVIDHRLVALRFAQLLGEVFTQRVELAT